MYFCLYLYEYQIRALHSKSGLFLFAFMYFFLIAYFWYDVIGDLIFAPPLALTSASFSSDDESSY